MSDLTVEQQQWHEWIIEARLEVDVDPVTVDVTGTHGLTKDRLSGKIAHGTCCDSSQDARPTELAA